MVSLSAGMAPKNSSEPWWHFSPVNAAVVGLKDIADGRLLGVGDIDDGTGLLV